MKHRKEFFDWENFYSLRENGEQETTTHILLMKMEKELVSVHCICNLKSIRRVQIWEGECVSWYLCMYLLIFQNQ